MVKKKPAFTLVELLIVIAIIGIMASFIIINTRNSQSRARDIQRAADLVALDDAINKYYRETGHYPDLPDGCGTNGSNGVSSDAVTRWATGNCLTPTGYIQNLVSKYLPKLPVDAGPQIYQDDRAIRGFVYFHSRVNPPQNIECYKIMAFNPENPRLNQYKSIWDPARDGGTNDNIVDGANVWAWSKYSQGCAAK
jgi:prepilin-type N-terminal cleavage/methylation domain-containing protein